MESIELAKKYFEEVENRFSNMTMLLYGSTVFGVNSSDLDICFIRENNLSEIEFQELKNFTRKFHKYNNLRIDEEIPYENKLIYTQDFIKKIIDISPFPYNGKKIIIPPIEKNKEFLNSLEMKKRLFLNILTVKHIIFGKDIEKFNKYSDIAWEIILKSVISYAELNEFSLDKILKCLYLDPYNNVSGELYLGYKKNLPEKIQYIEMQTENQLERLSNEKKLIKVLNKTYVAKKEWLNS